MMRLLSAAALAAVACASSALAGSPASDGTVLPASESLDAIPSTARFLYEGYLRSADGTPLSGRQRLTLAVFRGGDARTTDSGTLLYGETVEVEAVAGRVTHAVGTGTPTFGSPLDARTLSQAGLTDDPEQALWLQVSVGDEQKVHLPRTRLTAVPYAGYAADAGRLGGIPAAEFIRSLLHGHGRDAKAPVTAALDPTNNVSGQDAFIGGGKFN